MDFQVVAVEPAPCGGVWLRVEQVGGTIADHNMQGVVADQRPAFADLTAQLVPTAQVIDGGLAG